MCMISVIPSLLTPFSWSLGLLDYLFTCRLERYIGTEHTQILFQGMGNLSVAYEAQEKTMTGIRDTVQTTLTVYQSRNKIFPGTK